MLLLQFGGPRRHVVQHPLVSPPWLNGCPRRTDGAQSRAALSGNHTNSGIRTGSSAWWNARSRALIGLSRLLDAASERPKVVELGLQLNLRHLGFTSDFCSASLLAGHLLAPPPRRLFRVALYQPKSS